MFKCKSCGKRGFFLALDNGLCTDCASKQRALEYERQKKALMEAEAERVRKLYDPDILLDRMSRDRIIRPAMYQGLSMVYNYVIPVADVDRPVLYDMVKSGKYNVDLSLGDDGSVQLIHNDVVIGKLGEKASIASDWLKKGDPYICQFSTFKKGCEHVLLHLYRDDEARLRKCNMAIAKLTSCMSEEKQDNIMCLEPGQKLFVEDDDNGKWYVRDINFHEIGRLPAKYNRMHEDGSLRGMFFDHTETAENANGEPREIPFVRFYFD